MREYRVRHVIGERPSSVEIEGRTMEIPGDWLIFNAPRPLYASPVEYVIREAFSSGGFDYPERRGELYLDWTGEFVSGRFYAAVDPASEMAVNENVGLDAVVLAFHSENEILEMARARYSKMERIDPAEVDQLIAGDPRAVVSFMMSVLNDPDQ